MWGEDLALLLTELRTLGGELNNHRASAMIIGPETYDQLQTKLLEECDIRRFQRNTKFLAKTYFDLALSRLPNITAQNVKLYLLTALRIAVKFNENVSISQTYTIGWLVELTQGNFQHEEFIQAEADLLNVLAYRLHLATPYDYIPIFRPLVKKCGKEKVREKKLLTLIDLVISLPEFMLRSQEELFFACFNIVYGQLLQENEIRHLRSLIQNWAGIHQTEQTLRKLYSMMTGCSI